MPSLFLFHSLDSIYYFMIQLYPHTILIILYYIVGEFRGILVRCQSKDRPNGVYSCQPCCASGYQYRTTIDFGQRCWVPPPHHTTTTSSRSCRNGTITTASATIAQITQHRTATATSRNVNGREILRRMTTNYLGTDYDLLRKNCCTFAHEACLRLGIQEEEIPSWFYNLASLGAVTKETITKLTFEPIWTQLCCSITNGDDDDNNDHNNNSNNNNSSGERGLFEDEFKTPATSSKT